uniref:Uncharacterized protein LOC111113056 isoform X2 n=1 Tax=Crassostrea virginica TaxID=6565 RepID=A0A8B8BTT7_CRAVI|nr:uncharacterized protein LOC111113056 isoform X2 [Crassostrea virginica]
MDFLRTSWIAALGAFLSSFLLLYECSKLDGYNFTVWTTTSCPKNKKEWDDRSSLFNCNHESSLACLPNENYTELLEFCYPLQIILIQKGICLYLRKDDSKLYWYNCSHFQQGCPQENYKASTIYEHLSCVSLGRGCFLQEPSCKSVTEKPFQGTSSNELATYSSIWVMIVAPLLTIFFISVVATLLFLFFRRRKLKARKNNDEDAETSGGVEQQPLLGPNPDINSKDLLMDF